MSTVTTWPVVPGSYIVGDPKAPVAVCTLTTERLMSPIAGLPGVAIAGMVYTANLGITRIIVNVTSNPSIRFLLICGRDSQLFQPGQSLAALADYGVDGQKRIVGARGYDPTLTSIDANQVEQFRRQVKVVDWTGEEDLEALKERISALSARNPGPYMTEPGSVGVLTSSEKFESIRPGGQREPLVYDPKGYFVISIEPDKGEIVLRHYLPNHSPAHEMRGRGATSMLLGLLRDGLVTQLSHAGYLGEELSKAQTALQLGLRYDQDRPLRPRETQVKSDTEAPISPSQPQPPSKPRSQPLTLKQLEDSVPGSGVDIVLSVVEARENLLDGVFLSMDEAQPFSAYHKTDYPVQIQWTPATKIIMGEASELVIGALLRIIGTLENNHMIKAEQIVVLTRVAKVIP